MYIELAVKKLRHVPFYFLLLVLFAGCQSRPHVSGWSLAVEGTINSLLAPIGKGCTQSFKRQSAAECVDFTLSFIHSVERTWVYEDFRIRADGSLLMFRTRYSDFGAGLPFNEPGQFVEKNGQFIYSFERSFPTIHATVWNDETDYTLTVVNNIDGTLTECSYHLVKYFTPGEHLLIRAVHN